MIADIKQLAEKYHTEVVRMRRHIHKHPELSFQEHETSAYVRSVLEKAGIPCTTGHAQTGIIAILEGKKPGDKVIALRSELDALPITEQTDKEFKSVKEGVMHACGHDVHTASLLGTAMILKEMRDQISGRIMFVFQPGEEKAPGGASLMLEEGALNDPKPDLIIAQHVLPSMSTGTVGFKPGRYMASSDEIYLRISGKGGHAALPHQTTDVVLVASHIIVALQQIVSRLAEASIPTVLSFGRFIAEGAVNVIPREVAIEGTFRTMNENWRREAQQRMKEIATSMAVSMGAACEMTVVPGYPVLENDPQATRLLMRHASEYLGKEKVELMDIRMTAEDFAFYSLKMPAVLYRLGIRKEQQFAPAELHTPGFDVDEEALKTGMGTMAYLAIRSTDRIN